MLDVMHLLLNLRTIDIAEGPLPQKLERYSPHRLSVLRVQPQRLQARYCVPFGFLLHPNVVQKASQAAVPHIQIYLLKEPFDEVPVLEDEGENSLDVVFGDVFGL